MPRLVAGKPGHRKEWRAWVSGKDLTVRFGKVGATPQEKTKTLASPEAAKKELDKQIKKKLAEGYEDWSWHDDFDSGLRLVEAEMPLPVPPACDSVIPCGRENKVFGFGGGLGLMLSWEKQDDSWDGANWPNTFFLGIDKTVRLLGKLGLSHDYGYDLEGRSFFKNDTQGLIEILGLDAALAKTSNAKPPEKLV